MSKHGKIRWNNKCNRFYVDLSFQGKRHHIYKYLGYVPCTDMHIAERLLNDIRSEIDKGIFNPERYKKSKPLHLSAYSEQWLKTLDVEPSTLYEYNNSLKNHIIPALGNEFLPDINTDKLKVFQKSINRVPKGKKNVMDCLKQILKSAHQSGYILQVPVFPKLKVNKPKPRWILPEEQAKIVLQIPEEHRYIFYFGFLTGCRTSEARAFRWQDIRNTHIIFEVSFDRYETLKTVKGFNAEPFPLYKALRRLLGVTPKLHDYFVFPNPNTGRPYSKHISKYWNKACKKAGINIKLQNAFRHSFACNLLNAGHNKGIVQKLLRHSDPKMVDRYGDFSMNYLESSLEGLGENLPICKQSVN